MCTLMEGERRALEAGATLGLILLLSLCHLAYSFPSLSLSL